MSDKDPISYQPAGPDTREGRRLKLLGTFHYVVAVLLLIEVPTMFWSAYVYAEVSMHPPGPVSMTDFLELARKNHYSDELFSPALTCLALCSAASGWAMSCHRFRLFSFAAACVLCLAIPFGTAVGLPAIILLRRPTYKQLYNLKSNQPSIPVEKVIQ